MLSGFRAGADGFDQNRFREFLADAQSRVANLANETRLAAEELDDLFLAKAKFAQADPDFRRSGELLDAHYRAGFDVAQRANICPGAFAVDDHAGLRFFLFAHRGPK